MSVKMENKEKQISRFDKLAKQWDSKPARVEGAMKFVDKICESINSDISKFDVLDYGSGSGLVSFGFSDQVNSILGLDNSEGMIEVYNEKVKNIGLSNIKGEVHDINNESLKSDSFDLVATNMTMHHIKDTKMFIEKLSDSLKEDGYLFIADLVTEDGTFHSDNDGVEHFGFEVESIIEKYKECGLKNVSCETLTRIDKEINSYDVFVVWGQK